MINNPKQARNIIPGGKKKEKTRNFKIFVCAVYLRRKRIADLCKFTADVTAKASFCELKMANVSGIGQWHFTVAIGATFTYSFMSSTCIIYNQIIGLCSIAL